MQNRKRVLLFVLIGIASFYTGFIAFSDQRVLVFFRYTGYWVLALNFALFFYWLWRGYRQSWPKIWTYVCSRSGRIGLLAAVLGSVVLLRAETWDFKTVMDEHILASTAMTMHKEREPYTLTRIISMNAEPLGLRGFIDKRPIVQPFLVSVVHDLTGFRPRNGVYLNILLTPCLLFLLYVLSERLGGVLAGAGAVALFCSVPLLGYMCAGGGLQPLNMFLILLTCLLGGYYLKAPDDNRLGAFIYSALLMAQCRYETVLFVLPVGLIVIWSWIRMRELIVPWLLILCPVFLIPYLWQQRVFRVSEQMWQMGTNGRDLEPFGFKYAYDNIGRAVNFFFDFGSGTPNSWLLAAIGLVALLLFLVRGARRWRSFRQLSPLMQAGIIFISGFVLLFLLLLCYGWEFDNPIIQRLSLPLGIPFAIAGSYLLFGYCHSVRFHRITAILLAVYFIGYVFPVTSQRRYGLTYQATHEYALAEQFLKEHEGERMMIIADDVMFFTLFGTDVLSTPLANLRKEAFKYYLSQPNSPSIYYFSPSVYNPVQRTFEPSSLGDLDEDFVTETVWEKAYTHMRKVSFKRITDVKNVELIEPETYKNVGEYLKVWGKNVP